jgi:hypothetical protein
MVQGPALPNGPYNTDLKSNLTFETLVFTYGKAIYENTPINSF